MTGDWRVMYQGRDDLVHYVFGGRSLCGLEWLWGMTFMSDPGEGGWTPCPACRDVERRLGRKK